ncbi:DUF1648 domain-containing protein [Cohnella pontilimi]|uniref:DUF1648 domain-containing protein n=1 Tax=Cohnella pontilimi TaxID=2564100 RepID=A0A4U0F305_9BACL|nr:DUF5808 domain-containing protein [Cohnella pontilimi]TJY38927.1 DUF1648 domain-containing protein [Cohnella pontilimi]
MISWFMLGVINLVVILALALHPYIAAKAVLFGVYVPESDRSDPLVTGMRRRFALSVFFAAVLGDAAAARVVVASGGSDEVLMPVLFAIQILTVVIAYVRFRKAALQLKKDRGWESPAQAGKRVVNLQFHERSKSFNSAWYAVHLLIVAVSVIGAIVMWDRIPETLVTHYNGRWEADGWSEKSTGSVFQFNFIQLGMIVLFLLIHATVRHAKQVLDPAQPEKSMAREIRFRKQNAVFLWALSLMVVALFSLIQGSILYNWNHETVIAISIIFPAAVILFLILFMIYLSKQGWEGPNDPAFLEDNKWKAGGLFYYSKEDPALLVPKRIGLGYTINFAHPIGWVILGVILAAPLLIVIISLAN